MKKIKIILVVITLIIAEGLTFAYIEYFSNQELKHFFSDHTNNLKIKERAAEKTYILLTKNIFEQTINKPEILELFSKAHLADSLEKKEIRDSLYSLLYPTYNMLQENELKQIHFHLPNNESFLRFNKPEKYGDNLSDIRYSVVKANDTKQEQKGFERGRIVNGFHYVFPLIYKNIHIGSVEMCFTFQNLKSLFKESNDEVFGFMIKKNVTDTLLANSNEYTQCPLSDNYIHEKNSSFYINDDSLKILNQINQKIKSKISKQISNNENFSIHQKINGINYIISFISINNVEGKPSAYIYSYHKDYFISKYKERYYFAHFSSLSGFTLLALFIFLVLLKNEKLKENENEYMQAIFTTSEGYWAVNSKEETIEVNQAMCKMLGYTKEEMIGKIPFFFVDEKNAEIFKANMGENTSTNHRKYEITLKSKSGEDIKTLFSATLIKDSKGKIIKSFAFVSDVTEHQKTLNQLQLLSSVVEQSPAYIAVTDKNGIIEYVNASFEKITGYSKDEAVGRNIGFLKSGRTDKEIYKDLWTTLRKGEAWRGNFTNRHKDGGDYREQVIIAPVKNKKGEVIKYFTIKEDITISTRNELALKEAQKIAKMGNWELDIVKNKLYWSDEIYRMFDVKPQQFEATYEAFLKNIHPEDRDKVNQAYINSLKTKEPYDITHRLKLHSGEIKIVKEKCRSEFDDKGKPIKSIGIVQDITEQKLAEQIIVENEEKFRAITEQTSDGITIADVNGSYVFVNSTFSKMLGYSIQELLEMTVFDVKKNLNIDDYKNRIGEKGYKFEIILERKDKTVFTAEMTGDTIILGQKQLVLGVIRDISERKKAEIDLKMAKKDAENANRLKSEFLTNMSHEIRTPMNAIIGFSAILKKELKNNKFNSFAKKINKSGNNLLELINDILDLSKIEAEQLKLEEKPTNVYNLFNEIPLIFSSISDRKQIPVNIEIEKPLPSILKIDALRIRQILVNLVGNALKFTEEGAVLIKIKFSQSEANFNKNTGYLEIDVKDTGIGIPENQLEVIFDSFRQVDGQSTRKYGGTGLGLTITKRLVEMMNGQITVKSTVGEGSTFSIKLKNVEILEDQEKTTPKEEKSNIIFEKAKILHVEDDEYNRDLLSIYFEGKNIELKDAESGRVALKILESYIPDIIIMDIQMPGINGYETTKIIRENEKLKSIPVIALTANATKDEIKKYSHIFDSYLTKPTDGEKFIKEVAKYLKHKKINKENKEKQAKNTEKINFIEKLNQELENKFLEELKNDFNIKIKPLYYKDIANIIAVDEIKNFCKELKNIALKFNIKTLESYSDNLMTAMSHFDLDEVTRIKDIFPEIIKTVNGL